MQEPMIIELPRDLIVLDEKPKKLFEELMQKK